MQEYGTLKHAVWECKYHIVFMLRHRRQALQCAVAARPGPGFVLKGMAVKIFWMCVDPGCVRLRRLENYA